MAHVVISEFMDEAAVARLSAAHRVAYEPALVEDRDRLIGMAAGADALIVRNRTQVDAELLAKAPRLRCVGRLGVGLDNIDIPACAERSITVYPATGANDQAVAEYVIAAVLMLLRRAYAATAEVAAGAWPRTQLMGHEVAGKTLGLIGYGAIARQVAARAQALGMEIAASDPHLPAEDPAWADVTRLGLSDLLAQADAVSLHVPLTAETRHLLGAEAIAAMKPGAVLVNAARGGVVDEAALIEALGARQLGGAAVDVFETEPLSAAAGARFDGAPNLILTPHIAGVTVEANARVSHLIADRVLQHLEGP
ncbi:MAG: hydroxyacid dehydrogenase [Pseudomonadota bacterium]